MLKTLKDLEHFEIAGVSAADGEIGETFFTDTIKAKRAATAQYRPCEFPNLRVVRVRSQAPAFNIGKLGNFAAA